MPTLRPGLQRKVQSKEVRYESVWPFYLKSARR
nr:MAG TPA: hypothetical protein [Caudoviricetes sp.]